MDIPVIDVVIPFYNAEATLERAVTSVLKQTGLGQLWLVDDASSDGSSQWARDLAAQHPHVHYERMPSNGGVAKARNWGALQAQHEYVAFLDADDAYEEGALEVAASVFYFRPEVNVVRLALKPVGIAERYSQHPNFEYAWQHMRMTCGGNIAFRRSFFLACGGFPQDQLFRELGGEDGALGIATTKMSHVATLFEEAGVLHYCRDGMHAERLLDAILFGKPVEGVTPEKMAYAESVTDAIVARIGALRESLNAPAPGIKPLVLERS